MATRRPKVPRADALGSGSSAARPSTPAPRPGTAGPGSAGNSGADVIKAEFGATRTASKPSTAAAPTKAAGSGNKSAHKPAESGKSQATGKSQTAGKSQSAGKKPAASAKPASGGSGRTVPSAKEGRDTDPVPAKAFSGRMLALAVVMIAITIMLAPTVKIFLEKRAEISALEGEIASRKAEQTELNKQISRWQDPNYVKQQARDRINMVMPGETGYWVFGGEEAAGTPGGRTGSGSSANPENLPWVDALWESIRRSATD
ncbi:septum formation initiator family protein [Paenarthrobacter sp. GOM3]|uniref:FtsB family cell division protein n=1 Tax=Paenarthrobacter sp. GOM3 TaxID=2782567 RepID=UPI001BAC41A3|nr:septum formation initiator family protein [Paenarthrobacter sp. GOM3]WOH19898.1 septum formation initiator family protein [Paenarthrobacter sp. GOM3]